MIKIAVVLEKCEEGGFAASVPTLPGCFGEGETVEEALANIAGAIELHLEAIEDDLIVDDRAIVKELLWEPLSSFPTADAGRGWRRPDTRESVRPASSI